MAKKETSDFDFSEHERKVNEAFEEERRRRIRVEAFDQLIDFALDEAGVTVEEAIQAYIEDEASGAIYR